MSKLSKIALTIAGFSLLFVAIPRLFLQEWTHILFVPLVLFLAGVGIAILKDRHLFVDFFTMKTTKHGMNMGAVIVLTFVMIGTLNYLAHHFLNTKKYDWTKEKLNSLSDQSVQVLSSLEDTLDVKFFYGRAVQDVERTKEQFRGNIRLYEDKSSKVKTEFVSSVERPDLAEEYKVDSGDTVVFLVYKGRRQRVEKLDEEGITGAILKITKTETKTVYLTSGHGERDVESREPDGAADFKQALEDNRYTVKTLKLFEEGKVPSDAAMVVVLGPTQSLLEPELQALRDYAKNGGRLLVAADPGQRHNLAQLTKSLGVEFSNSFVIDPAGIMQTKAMGVALGIDYSRVSDLTKGLDKNSISLFYLAGSLKRAGDVAASLQTTEAVRTSPKSVLTSEIPKKDIRVIAGSEGPQTLVMTVSGKVDQGQAADMQAVIFADSDLFTNQFLFQALNRDLALNTVAFLADDKNNITIRPKAPTGSSLLLTQYQKLGLVLGYLVVSLLLFLTGGVVWLRRKYA